MGPSLTHRIEGSSDAEEVIFLGDRETLSDRPFEIVYDLGFFPVLPQCCKEEGRRSCPVRMGSGENEMMGQRGEETKNGLDVFILHHTKDEVEVMKLKLFFYGLF